MNSQRVWATILVLLFGTGLVWAQDGWIADSSGIVNALFDVGMTNSRNATAVGASGVILQTRDGGLTWQTQTSPVFYDLNAISYADSMHGVIAGFSGTILRTTNGGTSWDSVQAGLITIYNAAYYRNGERFGMVAGVNTIFQPLVTLTFNGWDGVGDQVFYLDHDSSNYEGAVTDITEPTPSVEIATCAVWDSHGAIVLKDGTHNWSTVYWATSVLHGVSFPTAEIGFAVGDNGQVIKSTDGGLTWAQLPWVLRLDWYDVKFISATTGWVCGENRTIYRTTNGGATWNQQLAEGNSTFYAIDFADSLHGIAVGENGRIYRTVNGGIPDQQLTPFARLSPADSSHDPFSHVPYVLFQWQASHDPEGRPIEYNFFLYNNLFTVVDTFLTDTSLLFPIPIPILDDFMPHHWLVVANDGIRERECSNGLGAFLITWDAADDLPTALLPHELTLTNYPNPFNPTTTISFSLPRAGTASLRVFDITGRTVLERDFGLMNQGPHDVWFNGTDLPSGIYIARLHAGNTQRSVKMTLIK